MVEVLAVYINCIFMNPVNHADEALPSNHQPAFFKQEALLIHYFKLTLRAF